MAAMEKTTTSVSQHKLVVVSPLQEAAPSDVSAQRGGTQARLSDLRKYLLRLYIYALVRTADINPSAIPALHHLNGKIVRL
jgi:hypothetical protein